MGCPLQSVFASASLATWRYLITVETQVWLTAAGEVAQSFRVPPACPRHYPQALASCFGGGAASD